MSPIPTQAPVVAGWQLSAGHRPPSGTESSFLSCNQYHTTISLQRSSRLVQKSASCLQRKIQKPRASHAWGKVRQPAVSPAGVSVSPFPTPCPCPYSSPHFPPRGSRCWVPWPCPCLSASFLLSGVQPGLNSPRSETVSSSSRAPSSRGLGQGSGQRGTLLLLT